MVVLYPVRFLAVVPLPFLTLERTLLPCHGRLALRAHGLHTVHNSCAETITLRIKSVGGSSSSSSGTASSAWTSVVAPHGSCRLPISMFRGGGRDGDGDGQLEVHMSVRHGDSKGSGSDDGDGWSESCDLAAAARAAAAMEDTREHVVVAASDAHRQYQFVTAARRVRAVNMVGGGGGWVSQRAGTSAAADGEQLLPPPRSYCWVGKCCFTICPVRPSVPLGCVVLYFAISTACPCEVPPFFAPPAPRLHAAAFIHQRSVIDCGCRPPPLRSLSFVYGS
eukprot:SAG22_NODE_2878_length_2132_cov_0.997049_2_plen_279_part_00